MRQIYLDSNAHLPMSKNTLKVYQDFNNSIAGHGNPSSPSVPGRAAASALESSRRKIAKLIGAEDASQIIFTNGGTQACHWGMRMLSTRFIGLTYISIIEHPAVTQGCEAEKGLIYSKLDVTSDGVVLFSKNIDPGSVACTHIQNEIGTIQDIKSINYSSCGVFSDFSQSLGKIPVNVKDLGVDIGVFCSHKFGGPSGVGFIYIKNHSSWIEFGSGSRYFMDIPGTPNVGGIVATAAALEEALSTLNIRTEKMLSFQNALEKSLIDFNFEVIGKNVSRSPNTTFVKTPTNVNALSLMLELGTLGIHCGLGSACGSLYTGGSPLMNALGRKSDGQEYLRFSQFGDYDDKDAKFVISKIEKVLNVLSR